MEGKNVKKIGFIGLLVIMLGFVVGGSADCVCSDFSNSVCVVAMANNASPPQANGMVCDAWVNIGQVTASSPPPVWTTITAAGAAFKADATWTRAMTITGTGLATPTSELWATEQRTSAANHDGTLGHGNGAPRKAMIATANNSLASMVTSPAPTNTGPKVVMRC